ncbi:hypothetical protein D3C71_524940 [compost metagenome]
MFPALHKQIDGRHKDIEPEIERQHAINDAHSHQPFQRLFEFVDGFDDERDRRVGMLFPNLRKNGMKALTGHPVRQNQPHIVAVIVLDPP